jgi:hypothetical protein
MARTSSSVELATLGFGQGGVYIRFFFGRELIRRLLYARELQENPRKFVLRLVGQRRHGFNSLFKQSGHTRKYSAFSTLRKAPTTSAAITIIDQPIGQFEKPSVIPG